MHLQFHPSAAAEFEEQVRYYHEIDPRLSERFQKEIVRLSNLILATPLIFNLRGDTWRRANLRIFPHYLAFTIRDELILLVAVAHTKRRPTYWSERLKSS